MKGFISNRSGTKKVFMTFLLSYLVVLLVPIVIGTVSYIRWNRGIKGEMENYNMAVLQQAQKTLDAYLRDIEQLTLDVGLNARIQKFLYVGAPLDVYDIYDSSQVINELAKYKNANNFIDGIYIFFKKTNTIINDTGKYEPLLFYDSISSYTDTKYDEWKGLLLQYHYRDYRSAKPMAGMAARKEVITYFQSLPFGTKDETLGTLVVMIDKAKIEDMMQDISILSKGAVYILKDDGQMVVGMGDKDLMESIKNESMNDDKGYFYDKVKGKEVIVSYISSTVRPWKYVSVVSAAVFLDKLNSIKGLTLSIVLLELAVGIMLAFVFANINYKPIKHVVDKLRERFNAGGDALILTDEMHFIEMIVDDTIERNESITKAMDEQRPILQANLLYQLIKGNYDNEDDIFRMLKSSGLAFPYDYFCVLTFDMDEHVGSSEKNDFAKKRSLLKIAVRSIVEGMRDDGVLTYIVDVAKERMAMIVNLNGKNGFKNKNQLLELGAQIRAFMTNNYAIFIDVGIGSIYQGLKGISDSYDESIRALALGMMKDDKDGISVYEDLGKKKQRYFYPIETEISLMRSIKLGDAEKTKVLLDRVFEQNFANGVMSLEMAHCLVFDLAGTVIKALNDIEVDCDDIFSEDFQMYEQLMKCRNLREARHSLDALYEAACQYADRNKGERCTSLKERILGYLNEHSDDMDLSLVAMASDLQISPAYLSSFFKEQMGEKFVDYLTRMKVEKAKQFLKDTSWPLEDIAAKVGYSNKSALTRAFKKLEGVTPGAYREISCRS